MVGLSIGEFLFDGSVETVQEVVGDVVLLVVDLCDEVVLICGYFGDGYEGLCNMDIMDVSVGQLFCDLLGKLYLV